MDLQQLFAVRPSTLLERQRTRGLLVDYYKNDIATVNLLMTAFDYGIIDKIRDAAPVDALKKNMMVAAFSQQYSIVEDKAAWAVELWISVITNDVLEQLAIAKEESAHRDAIVEPAFLGDDSTVHESIDGGTRDHGDDFYINPSLVEQDNCVYVPCGIGNTDCGFTIYGIKKQPLCQNKHGDVFALVYNYLIRTSKITDEDIPKFIKQIETPYELDYRSIFRLSITLLQLIKNNYTSNNVLEVDYHGEAEHLKYAVSLINHYTELFCRLAKLPIATLIVKQNPKAISVSLEEGTTVFCKGNKELSTNARELWYGRKINYRLSRSDLRDLEYILGEISPFDSFKEGQFEALQNMLAAKKHAVCIMPTGSGKSLIYYLASLLQPLPLFVVVPTEILIEDQLRNLQKFHHMDNVAHLKLTDENSFVDYEIRNSLNYLTPMTLQNRHLLVKFRYINDGTHLHKIYDKRAGSSLLQPERIAPGALLSYIVLDEIHCLSNWGHDFRPEYQMLSKYLNRFLDQIDFWGFTATANYTVVEDVQKQLNIPQENFFSPISFDKYNVSYDFRCVKTEEEMYTVAGEITQQLIARNERTIIFTKNDDVSKKLADVVGYEADIFSSDSPDAYHHFVDGKCKILIASEELGVGINLPNINNVMHFGLPLSKCEYVQEIGRAGRSNERVTSFVIYLDSAGGNVPEELLRRNTSIDRIPTLLDGITNDYAEIYRKLTNSCPTKEVLFDRLISFRNTLPTSNFIVRSFTWENLEMAKQYLYMLYTSGYVYDWYTYGHSKHSEGVDILIDICSSSAAIKDTLKRMKTHLRDYFDFLGDNRESVAKVNRASTPDEVIQVFVDWYYIKYLYHHNEQFLDLHDFIVSSASASNDTITNEIKDYFVLPFIKLKTDEAYYSEMTTKEIINKAVIGINKETLANIERINSNRYSYKFDLLLFCGRLRMEGYFDLNRFERVMERIPNSEKPLLVEAFPKLYAASEIPTRIAILNFLEISGSTIGLELNAFVEAAYKEGRKDLVYYGIMARKINPSLGLIGR